MTLTHPQIQEVSLEDRWRPWFTDISDGGASPANSRSRPGSARSKHKARLSALGDVTLSQYHNEDLLFMITALIVHYSQQNVDLHSGSQDESHESLHRRVSHFSQSQSGWSDAERIANMARGAHCSRAMVVERIQVTVANIKSQLNKAEVSRLEC